MILTIDWACKEVALERTVMIQAEETALVELECLLAVASLLAGQSKDQSSVWKLAHLLATMNVL